MKNIAVIVATVFISFAAVNAQDLQCYVCEGTQCDNLTDELLQSCGPDSPISNEPSTASPSIEPTTKSTDEPTQTFAPPDESSSGVPSTQISDASSTSTTQLVDESDLTETPSSPTQLTTDSREDHSYSSNPTTHPSENTSSSPNLTTQPTEDTPSPLMSTTQYADDTSLPPNVATQPTEDTPSPLMSTTQSTDDTSFSPKVPTQQTDDMPSSSIPTTQTSEETSQQSTTVQSRPTIEFIVDSSDKPTTTFATVPHPSPSLTVELESEATAVEDPLTLQETSNSPFMTRRSRRNINASASSSNNRYPVSRLTESNAYACYTIFEPSTGSTQVRRGCIVIPSNQTGCAAVRDKLQVQASTGDNCQVCLMNRCNDGTSLRISFVVLFLVCVRFLV